MSEQESVISSHEPAESESLMEEHDAVERESLLSETSAQERESVLSAQEPSESESLVSEAVTAESEGASRRTDVFSDVEVEHDATVGGTLRAHKLVTDMATGPEKGGHGFYSSGAAYDYNATHIGIDSSTQPDDGIVGLTLRNADDKALGIVAKLYTGLSSQDKASLSSGLSELKAWAETEFARLGLKYLSKTSADTASDIITFLEGVALGDGSYGVTGAGLATLAGVIAGQLRSPGFKAGYLDGKGFGMYTDGNGRAVTETDLLYVRMKAVFAELEVRKLSYVGGDQVHSFAGSTLQKVVPVDSTGSEVTDGSTPNAYKCYYLDDDGTTRTQNWWKVGDQARCQTFDIEAGVYQDMSNKYYWRLVVATGEEDVVTGTDPDGGSVTKHMGYVTLSNAGAGFTLKDPSDGTKNIQADGTDVTFIGYDTSAVNDAPAAGDKIVQLGSQCDPSRGYAYIIYVTEQRRVDYAGISDYDLAGHEVAQYSPRGSFAYSKYFQLRSGDPSAWHPMVNYRGAYDDTLAYSYYDEADYGGSLWLHIGTSDTTGVAPGTDGTVWQIVVAGYDDSSGARMVIETDGDYQLAWGESCTLTCRVEKGTRDLTSQVKAWAVERDTGDSAADALWAAKDKARNFAGSLLLVTGASEDDLGSGTSARFTFTASDSGGSTMAKRSLTFK